MSNFLLRSVPIAIGVILLYSGIYKLLHPAEAIYALEALDLPKWLAKGAVIGVTAVELYLGLISLFRVNLKYVFIATTMLMFSFTIFLWYLTTLASPPACGCMGLTGMFTSNKQAAFFGLVRNCVILWCLKLSYDNYFQPARGEPPDSCSVPAS